jgi:hypothetical protein
MSGIMRSAPTGFGEVSSRKHFLPPPLVVVIEHSFEQLQCIGCDNLKYVQSNIRRHKRVKTSLGKSGQFVQETLFKGEEP